MGDVLAWLAHSGVIQGLIIGATLAFLTAIVVLNTVIRKITTIVNGWESIPRCGRPGNGILVRAACAKALPVANVFEEAAYWTTAKDGSGHALNGGRDYILRFAAGQLPPSHAFWSITVTDVVGYMVSNPINRSSLNDRSELTHDADGSIDILLQRAVPVGNERNWLPTPSGRFRLMLRAYLPGAEILDGTYHPPPVLRA